MGLPPAGFVNFPLVTPLRTTALLNEKPVEPAVNSSAVAWFVPPESKLDCHLRLMGLTH